MIDLFRGWISSSDAFALLAAGVAVKATLLLLIALLADRCLRRHLLARSAAWQALLVGLALLPLAEVALPGWRLLRAERTEKTATSEQMIAAVRSAPPIASVRSATSSDRPSMMRAEARPQPSVELPIALTDALEEDIAADNTNWRAVAFFTAAAAYLAGVFLLVIRLIGSWLRVAALVKSSAPVDQSAWLAELDDCRGRLGIRRPVLLRQSAEVGVPVFVGWWRPTILLPTALANRARPDIVRTALIHELAHARRRDYAWNLLLRLLQAVYWPHPLVWLAGRTIGRVREAACDQVCVYWLGGAEAYRATLVDLAVRQARRPAISLGMAIARGSRLERRLNELALGHGLAHCLPGLGLRFGLVVFSIAVAAIVGSARLHDHAAVADDALAEAGQDKTASKETVEKGAAEKSSSATNDEAPADDDAAAEKVADQPADAKPEVPAGPPKVKVWKVRRADFVIRSNQPCEIEASQKVSVFSQVTGHITKRAVELGDKVKKGDTLATLDAPEVAENVLLAQADRDEAEAGRLRAAAAVDAANAEIEGAEAQVESANVALETAQSSFDYRQKRLKRMTDLVALKGVEERLADEAQEAAEQAKGELRAKKSAVQAAKIDVKRSHAQLEAAQAAMRGAEIRLASVQKRLERLRQAGDLLEVKSPIDGIVIEVNAAVGTLASSTGERRPLFVVARDDLVAGVAQLPAFEALKVKRGDPATVRIDALRGREFEAKVSRVAYSIDPKTRTLRTEVDLDNRDGHLRLGMFGQLSIPLETHRDVIAIPRMSFFSNPAFDGMLVYRVVDGRLRETKVRIGPQSDDQSEVVDGLSEGDLLVTNPNNVWKRGKGKYEGERVEIDDEPETEQ